MAKTTRTVSTEGFESTSEIREFELMADPTGEAAPDTLEILLADYAACAVPAFRVGAQQRGIDDLGRLEIGMTGELNDDDKLESIALEASVETDLTDDEAAAVIERVEALCKVHDAVKPSLHAEMTLTGDAF